MSKKRKGKKGKGSAGKRSAGKGSAGGGGAGGGQSKNPRDVPTTVSVARTPEASSQGGAPAAAAPPAKAGQAGARTPAAGDRGGAAPAARAPGNGLLYALLAILGLGVAVAVYLVRHKLKITLDPTYVSACNLGGAIDCDKVNTSAYSELFGLPISLLAIPTYLTMAFFAWRALASRRANAAAERETATVTLEAVACIGLLTIVYSLFLAWVSSVWIRAYCLFCISLYVVNVASTVLAFAAGRFSLPAAIVGSLRALASMRRPIPAGIGVLLLSAAVAWGGYEAAESTMTAAYKRRVDEQLSEKITIDHSADAGAAADGTQTARGAETSAAEPAASPPERSPLGVRGGQKTEDGWTYFEAPLDEDHEFWLGPKDAKVTVVKYADFQCAYCRSLAQSMEPIEKKYGDRVRFVMKNFPMNIKCNRAMRGFDKHPIACELAYAAHCAGEQGKFWQMHDELYHNQPSLTLDSPKKFAAKLGLDMPKFEACLDAPETKAAIRADVESGLYAGIYGTPRTYINNRLVTGSANTAILEYYIDKAFDALASGKAAATNASAQKMAPKPDGRSMIAARKQSGTFCIDPYEAAITKDGRAVSQPGLTPAQADYYTAKDACEKSGKRLCTEEEWVSACGGKPAVDENHNKMFADDLMEGNMYPYGTYYEEGYCQDRADQRTGQTVATGSKERCRTPSGIFDLAGNIEEWTDAANDRPTMLGGSMSSATGAACNRRTFTAPPGTRNRTTGFRCCADTNVQSKLVTAADLRENLTSLVDLPVPEFSVEDSTGKPILSKEFTGNVTLLNFFASWCGPCTREFPHLVEYAEKYAPQGLQIIGVGVDTVAKRSTDFADGFDVDFPIVTDTNALLKGKFLVYEMPATFLIDRQGVVRYSVTGFSGADQEAEMRKAIEKLL